MTDSDAKAVLSGEMHDRDASHGSSGLVRSIPITTNSTRGVQTVVDKPKSLGQQYYEDVEAVKAEGLSNANAIRQVAEKYGKQENAIRGGIHQYKRANLGAAAAPPRGRRQARLSVDDYLSSARQALESALRLIDSEVDEAKATLDTAQARYDQVVAAVGERKASIEAKLAALA